MSGVAYDQHDAPMVARLVAAQRMESAIRDELRSSSRSTQVGSFMQLPDAQQLARDLMDAHGLADWAFRFDRAARRFGSCCERDRVITLSAKLTLLNSEAQVRETILHEIAHGLTPGDGHGARWRNTCHRLGIEPKRCFTDREVSMPARRPGRYEVGCQSCGWWHDRHRLNGRSLVCRRCKQPVLYRERSTGRPFRIIGRGRRARVEFVTAASVTI